MAIREHKVDVWKYLLPIPGMLARTLKNMVNGYDSRFLAGSFPEVLRFAKESNLDADAKIRIVTLHACIRDNYSLSLEVLLNLIEQPSIKAALAPKARRVELFLATAKHKPHAIGTLAAYNLSPFDFLTAWHQLFMEASPEDRESPRARVGHFTGHRSWPLEFEIVKDIIQYGGLSTLISMKSFISEHLPMEFIDYALKAKKYDMVQELLMNWGVRVTEQTLAQIIFGIAIDALDAKILAPALRQAVKVDIDSLRSLM
ncbi:hypothetical protein HK097_006208 [Rhizophlyctis rosea]|uniref:Uncharacterized protein n=1 Tax=Rhizophlyctis rosea TaxID=64517 RepID=A0AAD5SDH1_9FUNG|nr:hypothetical protein HK097_006208 [Rhizophlyctis rosea]